jgi:MoxR-like ATPase
MQEKEVSVAGQRRILPRPFHVLATQNPIEQEGTYPLPEAQLDRFLLRIGFGYPSPDEEWEVLARRVERKTDEVAIRPVVDRPTVLELQGAMEAVHVGPSVGRYIVDVVTATRASGSASVGASPRGSLALLKLSRCRAALAGRDFVTPDDVKAVAVPALSHRIMLKPELWVQRLSADDVIRDVIETVPTPRAEDAAASA